MEPETSQAAQGVGETTIGARPYRAELNVIAKTLRHHIDTDYPITPEIRKGMVQDALLLCQSDSDRVRVAALRVLALLDQVNVRREANAIQEHGQDLAAQTERARALLSDPSVRAAMASLASAGQPSAPVPTTQPVEPPEEALRVERGDGWASAGGSTDE